jgi:hypothetical protein
MGWIRGFFCAKVLKFSNASVAEWSIALDCKSGAFGLRRFESFPTHNFDFVLKNFISEAILCLTKTELYYIIKQLMKPSNQSR